MTKSSGVSTALILKEQPDKSKAIGLIAKHLEKIAMLWQIPNWTPNNSVLLAEWVYENYSYEPLEVILKALTSPPVAEDKTYRLTPDVVKGWLTAELEREAIKREKEEEKAKEDFKAELPHVDYEAFKKRVEEGTALRPDHTKNKRPWQSDPDYQKFSMEQHARWRKNLSGMQGTGEILHPGKQVPET